MTEKNPTPQEQALKIIAELVGDRDFDYYIDIAFDAIGNKLAKNALFKGLGIDPETAGMSEVLEALVRAKILDADAAELPDDFNEAVGDLYPFGNTPESFPRGLLTGLHSRLKEAIDKLAKKDAKAKP